MNTRFLNIPSYLRATCQKRFWGLLVIALTAVSTLQAHQLGGISWGTSQPYDRGYNPSVASANGNWTVEVHNGQNGDGPMWYHVGEVAFNWPSPIVNWGPYQQYDTGYDPAIAGCQGSNVMVEVHNGQERQGPMWYRVGSIQGDTPSSAFIIWGPSREFDQGWEPRVALLCGSYGEFTVVEVHNGLSNPRGGTMTMYYHVGVINEDLQSITWGPAYPYDIGYNPSVAAYGQTVVEVHNNAGGTPGSLWYHVGILNENLTIGWGPPLQYDIGWQPKVAVIASNGQDDLGSTTSAPFAIEVHNGQGNFGPMWYHLGQVDLNNLNIAWGPPQEYDQGWNPSVAWLEMEVGNGFDLGAIEVHNGQTGFGWMWSHGDLWIPPGGLTVNGN